MRTDVLQVEQNGLIVTIPDNKLLAQAIYNFLSRGKKFDTLIVSLFFQKSNLKINEKINGAKIIKLSNRDITIDNSKMYIEDFINKEIGKKIKYIKDYNLYLNENNTFLYIDKILKIANTIIKTTKPTEENRKKLIELEKKIQILIENAELSWIKTIKQHYGKSKVIQDAISLRKDSIISKADIAVKDKINNRKINKIEIYKALKDAVVVEDPANILLSLGLQYKSLKNSSRYQFAIRDERTPSSFIEIRGGVWRWKDFGTDDFGTIIDVVQKYTSLEFKDALLYCAEHLGIHNPLYDIENIESSKKRINSIKDNVAKKNKENKNKENIEISSKVKSVLPIQPNTVASKYLESRGIKDIPRGINVIVGEYIDKNNEIKKIWGVGVLNINGGADIHFIKKIGNLKSRVIGFPGITHIKAENNNSEKVAIFEAKFDYAAMMQKYSKYFKNVNIIIANSASNFRDVVEYIKDNNLGQKSISIFGQNDLAGATFDYKVVEALESHTNSIYTIDYKNIQYGKDINDLLLENKLDCFDEKLFTSFRLTNYKQLEKRVSALENIKKNQKIKKNEESRVKINNKMR